MRQKLDATFEEKLPLLCIIGLGYVGLPLAVAFGEKQKVIGFDTDKQRIDDLRINKDKTLELTPQEIAAAEFIQFCHNPKEIADAQIYIVTVPSPIDIHNQPNIKPITSACETIASVLSPGNIVIFESTVYPGFTYNICVPILEEKSGLTFNEDFFCGYSPERINPGDKVNTIKNVVKITSGSTPETAKTVDNLYASIVEAGTYLAPSIEVAEAAKVIENAQRDLNIAFMNELALIFDKLQIDTNEVLEAASTKWNFLPFKPGMVGGHCIGVDPYYLTYRAIEVGYTPRITLTGRLLNDRMSEHIAKKLLQLFSLSNNSNQNMRLAVLGITFKENCPDTRNSKVFDMIDELISFGFEILWHDPFCSAATAGLNEKAKFRELEELEQQVDGVVVAVGHTLYRNLQASTIKSMYRSDSRTLADIKAIFDKDKMTAEGFTVWRL